jgi:hypothetical protein
VPKSADILRIPKGDANYRYRKYQLFKTVYFFRFVGEIKGFTPDTITPIYWVAFPIKKGGLLMSIHVLCSTGQSEQ